MKPLLTLFFLINISLAAGACPLHQALGVAPAESEYMIRVDDETTSTVTKESFLRHFYNIFFQNNIELQKFTLPVVPMPDWEKPYFTAYTVEIDGIINMGFWGGMARIPGMDDDGVAFITCHEVGHILGGTPRYKLKNFEQLTSEGQADYYAPSCLKKYFMNDPLIMDELQKKQDPYNLKLCKEKYSSNMDLAVCLRSLKGIHAFAQMIGYMQRIQGTPSIESQDTSEVAETLFDSYPSHQCRIDTMVAGVLGLDRPKCWYRNEPLVTLTQ